jgi:glutathione synthase/RimK-type ligase-like ATP-grasp enzyme
MTIALITSAEIGLTSDVELLVAALGNREVDVRVIGWEDATTDWTSVQLGILCSTHGRSRRLRLNDLLAWTRALSQRIEVWNPPDVLDWACHKSYLIELATKGILTVPTVYLARGSVINLSAVMRDREWTEVVVKPAVGSGSLGVTRVSTWTLSDAQQRLERHLTCRDMMIQPYLASVETDGELSVIFWNGQISHAVRKVPVPGHFTAQIWNSTISLATLTPPEEALAAKVLEVLGAPVRMGRIDVLRDARGDSFLLEVELISPLLYLHVAHGAADRLAELVAARHNVRHSAA